MSFRPDRHAIVLTVVLLAQAGMVYRGSPTERVPARQALAGLPARIGSWAIEGEHALSQEALDVLRATDTVSRTYSRSPAEPNVNLFVAYFESQRTGQTPHSPKHCLPGAGFEPLESGYLHIAVPDRPQTIQVNRYIVARGNERSVVLYWYQSQGRVVASEYWSKLWLVLDAMRYNRSDTAIVRVVVPVTRNIDDEDATSLGVEFVRAVFPLLSGYLPA